MAKGTECFLADEEWRTISPQSSSLTLAPDSFVTSNDMLNLFARVPGLLQRTKQLYSGGTAASWPVLLDEAVAIRMELMLCYNEYTSYRGSEAPAWYEVPSGSEASILPTIIVYPDVSAGTLIPTYYGALIQVNRAIDTIRQSNEHAEENLELAKKICMSADFCWKSGYCGLQTMKGALPVAASILPYRYHVFIKDWESRFQALDEGSRMRATFLETNYSNSVPI
jgi:hypothetical protein